MDKPKPSKKSFNELMEEAKKKKPFPPDEIVWQSPPTVIARIKHDK